MRIFTRLRSDGESGLVDAFCNDGAVGSCPVDYVAGNIWGDCTNCGAKRLTLIIQCRPVNGRVSGFAGFCK